MDVFAGRQPMPGHRSAALNMLRDKPPKETIKAGPFFLGQLFQTRGQGLGQLHSRFHL